MNWLAFSLITVTLWGVGQVLIKKGLSNISSFWSIVVSGTINALVLIPFSLLSGAEFTITPLFFFVIFTIAFLNMLFFYAIEKGQLALSGTLFATYPVVTILLSSIFLQEELHVSQYFMIALILGGGAILGYTGSSSSGKQKVAKSWFFWAILGSVGVGVADFLAKVAINTTGVPTYNLFFPLAYIIGILVYFVLDRKGRMLPKNIQPRKFLWSISGVLLLTLGMVSFNYALEHGDVSLVATVSSSYAAVTVILASTFLREKITRIQLIGIIAILTGVTFISIK